MIPAGRAARRRPWLEHSARRPAANINRAVLSYALTGRAHVPRAFEQAPACINVLDLGDGGEWIVRAVNVAPYDLLHLAHRQTTMERYWRQWLVF